MAPPKERPMVTVPVPLGPRCTASFTLPRDVTRAEAERFVRVLTAWLGLADLARNEPPGAEDGARHG